MKVLQCHSKGDKRFSAFVAKASVYGEHETIEYHYQKCKNFEGLKKPSRTATYTEKLDFIREVKRLQKEGHKPISITVGKYELDVSLLTPFYKMLWYLYLNGNLHLVDYASQYDEFEDIFGKNAMNNQADVIRQYIKEGPISMMEDIKPLLKELELKAKA